MQFMVHTTFYVVYMVLYTLILPVWSHTGQWGWTAHTTTIYPLFNSGDTGRMIIEICLWAYLLGRVVEESEQLRKSSLTDYLGEVRSSPAFHALR